MIREQVSLIVYVFRQSCMPVMQVVQEFILQSRACMHACNNLNDINACTGGFDVVEEGDCFGVLRYHDFTALTNFSFRFKCKVIPPASLNQFSGFIVEVAVTNGTCRQTG